MLHGVIACAGGQIDVSGAPTEIKIVPLGTVHSQKGDFFVDDESVESIIKLYKGRNLDLVIDYEHQTLEDVQAPAGGWIKDMWKGDDALIAKVEWTSKATEYLKNKEYKYLSPVVITRKRDKKAIAIHSVALTNTPAIDGMFAIVNSLNIDEYENNDPYKGGSKMDLLKLIKALGLEEGATEEDVLKAITEAIKASKEKDTDTDSPTDPEGKDGVEVVANSTILSLLGLDVTAKTEDVTAMIMSYKAGDSNAMQEVLKLKAQMEKRNAEDLVTTALKAGKITAAQKDWAKAYALKDATGFKSFVDKAPQVVPTDKLNLEDAPKTDDSENIDMKILKNCGVSLDDVKKYTTRKDED